MKPETTPADPLPPRVALFAPWRWLSHWKPWQRRVLLACVIVAAYLQSPVLGYYFVLATPNPWVYSAYKEFCWPALWLAERCPPLYEFYMVQWRWIIDRRRPPHSR